VIIVTGSVTGSDDTIAQMLELSIEHVRRSRQEPGCLAHGVYRDAENPLRLIFVEQWADEPALRQHFSVPESAEFVTHLGQLATGSPSLAMYDATEVSAR
jgi:quinol monooxygenase YgiN